MIGIGWMPRIGPTLAAVLSLAVTTGAAPRAAGHRGNPAGHRRLGDVMVWLKAHLISGYQPPL
jgi:hypothetical protein